VQAAVPVASRHVAKTDPMSFSSRRSITPYRRVATSSLGVGATVAMTSGEEVDIARP